MPCMILHPCAWPPHHAPMRDLPLSPTRALSNVPALFFAMHTIPFPRDVHALSQQLSQSYCTRAQTPQCTHAKQFFRPHSCLSSPSLHLLAPTDVGCVHSRTPPQSHAPSLYSNLCVPAQHKVLTCRRPHSHIHTLSCHSCWDVTRWGHGKRSPCPVPPNLSHHTRISV